MASEIHGYQHGVREVFFIDFVFKKLVFCLLFVCARVRISLLLGISVVNSDSGGRASQVISRFQVSCSIQLDSHNYCSSMCSLVLDHNQLHVGLYVR